MVGYVIVFAYIVCSVYYCFCVVCRRSSGVRVVSFGGCGVMLLFNLLSECNVSVLCSTSYSRSSCKISAFAVAGSQWQRQCKRRRCLSRCKQKGSAAGNAVCGSPGRAPLGFDGQRTTKRHNGAPLASARQRRTLGCFGDAAAAAAVAALPMPMVRRQHCAHTPAANRRASLRLTKAAKAAAKAPNRTLASVYGLKTRRRGAACRR